MTFLLLIIAAVAGVIYWATDSKPKLQELSRMTYAVSLLAFMLTYKF